MSFEPTGVAIHHSATEDGVDDEPDTDAIKSYHINKNNWSDIGYHKLIESVSRSVEIIEGRPDDKQGAHVKEKNSKLLGICFVGNYSKYRLPAKYIEMGAKAIFGWMDKYNITISRVRMHRDWDPGHTRCPGKKFPIEELIEKIKSLWYSKLFKGENSYNLKQKQRLLDIAGYSPELIDGIMGPKTRKAIRSASSDILNKENDEWSDELELRLKQKISSKNDSTRRKISNIVKSMRDSLDHFDENLKKIRNEIK